MNEERDELSKIRRALLLQLRVEMHDEIMLNYEGGGDELHMTEIENGSDRRDLVDFLVSYVEHSHHGFWNNDGGYGEVRWDIKEDKITVSHVDYIMSEEHYPDEEF